MNMLQSTYNWIMPIASFTKKSKKEHKKTPIFEFDLVFFEEGQKLNFYTSFKF